MSEIKESLLAEDHDYGVGATLIDTTEGSFLEKKL
jgi:hypothetical protein